MRLKAVVVLAAACACAAVAAGAGRAQLPTPPTTTVPAVPPVSVPSPPSLPQLPAPPAPTPPPVAPTPSPSAPAPPTAAAPSVPQVTTTARVPAAPAVPQAPPPPSGTTARDLPSTPTGREAPAAPGRDVLARSGSSVATAGGSDSRSGTASTGNWTAQSPPPSELVVSEARPAASARGARVSGFRVVRPWIALDSRLGRRATTLVVVLARPGPIRFVLRQLAPRCRFLGTFTSPGENGVNRIRFRARGRKLLTPGTYLLTVRPLGTPVGVNARRVRLVVVDDDAPGAALRAMLGANACDAAPATTLEAAVSPETFRQATFTGIRLTHGTEAAAARPEPQRRADAKPSSPVAKAVGRLLPSGQALGASFEKVRDEDAWAVPVLAGLLVLATLLIGAAALPSAVMPAAPLAAALAYRRHELRIAGLAALASAALLYLVALLA